MFVIGRSVTCPLIYPQMRASVIQSDFAPVFDKFKKSSTARFEYLGTTERDDNSFVLLQSLDVTQTRAKCSKS